MNCFLLSVVVLIQMCGIQASETEVHGESAQDGAKKIAEADAMYSWEIYEGNGWMHVPNVIFKDELPERLSLFEKRTPLCLCAIHCCLKNKEKSTTQ